MRSVLRGLTVRGFVVPGGLVGALGDVRRGAAAGRAFGDTDLEVAKESIILPDGSRPAQRSAVVTAGPDVAIRMLQTGGSSGERSLTCVDPS